MELTLQSDDLFQVMKVHMTTEQEQIFMASHYLYLQHGADSTKFVVDFDDVWKNVDFTRRGNAKRILTNNFTENENYRVLVVGSEDCEKLLLFREKLLLETWADPDRTKKRYY